jgi:hypothetical protein
VANRTKRTPEKDDAFFVAVVESGGNITKACAESSYGRTAVYDYKANDSEFATRLAESVEKGMDVLEQECIRRARDGTLEPVFHKGEQCGTIRKYSDTLAIFLLKGARPEKYRERLSVSLQDATPAQIADAITRLTDDDLRRVISRRSAVSGTEKP